MEPSDNSLSGDVQYAGAADGSGQEGRDNLKRLSALRSENAKRLWQKPGFRERMAQTHSDGRRWRGKHKINQHAHPLVRQLFRIINEELATLSEIAERAGTTRNRIKQWQYSVPRMDLFIACLNAMDYDLVIKKNGEEIKASERLEVVIQEKTYPCRMTPSQKGVYDVLRERWPRFSSHYVIAERAEVAKDSVKVLLSQMRKLGVKISTKWGEGAALAEKPL